VSEGPTGNTLRSLAHASPWDILIRRSPKNDSAIAYRSLGGRAIAGVAGR